MKTTRRSSPKPLIIATILHPASIKVNSHYDDPDSEQIANEKWFYEEHGFLPAVAVNEANELLRGHARVEAATQLGLTSIPVLRIPPSLEHQYRSDRADARTRRPRRTKTPNS